MALAQSIPSLRKELQALVVDNNLSAALTLCKELLSENAEKLNDILALQTNLNQLNREWNNGTIDQEKYAIRLAQINQAFLNFVSALEESDFETPAAKTAKTPGNNAQLGSVLYRVPHHMPLAKASICTIRVAIDDEAIVKDIDMDSDVRLRKQVEVSERMSAELLDIEGKVFDIAALSARDQNVRPTGYTQWLFRVTPLLEGEHQLLVKVSLLEFDPNTKEYLPREVSVLETVTVVTATQHSDEEEAPMKSTGQSFVMGPNAGQKDKQTKIPWWKNLTQRGTALFLAFLTFTSVSVTTWAVTPEIKRDWWWATLRNSPEAYAGFIAEHKTDAKGDAQNLLIEKAYFYKAERSNSLNDLREYQNNYPGGEFQFRGEVLKKIATLEWKEVESIQKDPQPLKIQKYLAHFPDATRLPEVVKAVAKLPAAQQAELLPQVEQAYVQSMEAKPTARKLLQYSRDFPQLTRLNDLAKAAANQPERVPVIQPVLEKIVLARVKTASTPEEVMALLPALKTLGRTETLNKVKKLVQKNPALQQADLQAEIAEATQTSAAVEAQRAEAERQRRAAADKAAQTRREQEAAEQERLAREAEEKRQQTAAAEKAEQERLAKEAEESNILQPAMVLVKGGTFNMGDDKSGLSYEKPVHAVTLSDFYIAKTEVTQALWRAVMGNEPSGFKNCDQCPVENVSWDDVQAFIQKLNAKTNKKYRLPTEAEWEYAARGGSKSQAFTYAGSNNPEEVGWYDSNSGSKTHPVGQKKANELGLHDMIGNVWEWCQDWHDGQYYQKRPVNNPQGPNTGGNRVNRGGSWLSPLIIARVAFRNGNRPGRQENDIGFRLARQQ